ncbi:MAG TPA: MFS transporter, partial [Alphaproteobacteria bacterium]|nr:MFS transporter [Alphaproteobacteria bacterium]
MMLLIVPLYFGTFYLGPTFAMVQGLVEVRMRAIAAAVLLFVLNLIGLGLGPQIVGIVSDLLTPIFGIEALRYALMAVFLGNLWSAFHYYIAS